MLDKLKDLEFNGGGGKAHELLVYKQLENSVNWWKKSKKNIVLLKKRMLIKMWI